MKYLRWIPLFLILAVPAPAIQFPPKPPSRDFYIDQARLLNPEDAQAVNTVSKALLNEEQIPIITATIPSLISYQVGHLTVEQYATQLFDHWGIGRKERNYGILLLVSVGDRKARIELGAGWGRSHDADAEYIMNTLIIPAFRRGDFSGGIRAGVEALDKMARGLALPKAKTPVWVPVVTILGFALVVGVIISLFKSGRTGWGWALLAALGVLIFFMLRSAARGGGSGGSFGGGFSGGGGATGSW